MVRAGDVIENPSMGARIRFVTVAEDSGGSLLEFDFFLRPGGVVATEHLHPQQEERFLITSGQITLRMDGRERVYTAGENITIPRGTPHIWWNSGTDDLRVMLDFRPAGRFAEFITTFFALAMTGKTNARGLPRNLFQLAVTFADYREAIYGTSPPRVVQQLLFATLAPLGRLLGYRPDVP